MNCTLLIWIAPVPPKFTLKGKSVVPLPQVKPAGSGGNGTARPGCTSIVVVDGGDPLAMREILMPLRIEVIDLERSVNVFCGNGFA